MITWDIFNGMVHNLPFLEIGKAIADGLNGICSRISFREIADTLATGLNGAFTTLYSFTRRFDWTGLVTTLPEELIPLFQSSTGRIMGANWKLS